MRKTGVKGMRNGKEERLRCVRGFLIDVFGILSTAALNSVIQKTGVQ